jgi:hypothetical protein
MTESVPKIYNRSPVCRRLEPHIHAPETVLTDNFPTENTWELNFNGLAAVSPLFEATGVTDYCITRRYERMSDKKAKGRLKECDLLTSNIELQINTDHLGNCMDYSPLEQHFIRNNRTTTYFLPHSAIDEGVTTNRNLGKNYG